MSNYARRPVRILAGVLAGALAVSVSPLLGLTSAGALEPATGDGSVCEDAPLAEPFTDVSATDSAVNEIACLFNTGITTGVTATTYEPLSPVTRRQMALFLVRMADEIEDKATGAVTPLPAADGTNAFTDIADEAAEIKAAIDRLDNAGVTTGVTPTTFVPEANVTRRQMAKFIVRLQEFMFGADITPDNAPDAFTDDDGDSGEDELNVLAAEGVFLGNGAPNTGTVSPGADITRRQMAFVIIRKLQYLFEEGEIGRLFAEDDGDSGTVTSAANSDIVAFDTAAGESLTAAITADTDTTDTFFIDGAAATEAAFKLAASPGDQIVVSKTDADADYDVHRLTNMPVPTSGMVGAVGLDTNDFSIITAAGTVLSTDVFGDVEDSYSVNGAAVSQVGFEANLSLGDTVQTDVTNLNVEADAYALTNGSWTGTVGSVAGADPVTFTADAVGDDPALGAQDATFSASSAKAIAGTQTFTVGGTAATYAQFVSALTNGDTVVYSRSAGVETFALTNVAPAAVTGTATDDIDLALDTIVLAIGASDVPVDYTALAAYRVDGVVVTIDQFEAALTPGDSVTFQANNPDTAADEGAISLTNAALQGSVRGISLAGDTLDVTNASANIIADDVDYTTAYFGGAPRYFVNGTEVLVATFDDYIDKAFADATPDETIVIEDVNTALGADISTNYRLTTDEVLP